MTLGGVTFDVASYPSFGTLRPFVLGNLVEIVLAAELVEAAVGVADLVAVSLDRDLASALVVYVVIKDIFSSWSEQIRGLIAHDVLRLSTHVRVSLRDALLAVRLVHVHQLLDQNVL